MSCRIFYYILIIFLVVVFVSPRPITCQPSLILFFYGGDVVCEWIRVRKGRKLHKTQQMEGAKMCKWKKQ